VTILNSDGIQQPLKLTINSFIRSILMHVTIRNCWNSIFWNC